MGKRRATMLIHFLPDCGQYGNRLETIKMKVLEKIMNILGLRQVEATSMLNDHDSKKIVQGTKILYCKMGTKIPKERRNG